MGLILTCYDESTLGHSYGRTSRNLSGGISELNEAYLIISDLRYVLRGYRSTDYASQASPTSRQRYTQDSYSLLLSRK